MSRLCSFLIISYFFSIFTSTAVFATDGEERRARPELALKFIMSSSTEKWAPGYGGAVSIEYAFVRYFSLATELAFRSVEVRPLAGYRDGWTFGRASLLEIGFTPKVIVPIEFKTGTLVPYAGPHFAYAPLHLVENRNSWGATFGGALFGTKYYFAKHWGMSADYGFQFEARTSALAYLMVSHRVALSGIFSF